MKIKEMQVGQSGKVTGYNLSDRAYRHKLLRMGLIKGTTFVVVRRAPMGDPVEVELRGFKLSLRREEADAMEVELV